MNIKASDRLKSAKLWKGSILDECDELGILTRKQLEDKIHSLEYIQNRTLAENELLSCLKAEMRQFNPPN
jgi:hypothetical protein